MLLWVDKDKNEQSKPWQWSNWKKEINKIIKIASDFQKLKMSSSDPLK